MSDGDVSCTSYRRLHRPCVFRASPWTSGEVASIEGGVGWHLSRQGPHEEVNMKGQTTRVIVTLLVVIGLLLSVTSVALASQPPGQKGGDA